MMHDWLAASVRDYFVLKIENPKYVFDDAKLVEKVSRFIVPGQILKHFKKTIMKFYKNIKKLENILFSKT